MQFSRMINVVGVHAAGELNEVITGGVLNVPGRTVFEKMRHLETKRRLAEAVSAAGAAGAHHAMREPGSAGH